MSLTPRNIIVDSPIALSALLNDVYDPFYSFEASPIYTSISCEISVNGSYYGKVGTSYEDIEYDYTGLTFPALTRTRISVRDAEWNFNDPESVNLYRSGVYVRADLGSVFGLFPEDKCVVVQGWRTERGNTPAPFDPPFFETASMRFENYENAGTRTDHGADPPTQSALKATFSVGVPNIIGSITGGDLKLRISIGYRLNLDIAQGERREGSVWYEQDISGWTSGNFRDIRGTYGGTVTDEEGLEYTFSLTIA